MPAGQSRSRLPTLINIQKLTHEKFDVERPRFYYPSIEKAYYVAFESQQEGVFHNARLARLNVLTHERPLGLRSTNVSQWHPEIHPSHFEGAGRARVRPPGSGLTTPNPEMITRISLAIRRILRWQRAALDVAHTLRWVDLRELRPEQVREGSPPRVLCMAISFWFRAITLMHAGSTGAGTPEDHELCRLTFYEHYPNLPEGVYLKDEQGRYLRPSPNFERWLFLRASDYAFSEFVQLATWIHKRTEDPSVKFKQTVYSCRHDRFSIVQSPSRMLEVRRQGKRLTARYWKDSPLVDIALSHKALSAIEACARHRPCDCPQGNRFGSPSR